MSDLLTFPATRLEEAERMTEDEFMLFAPEKPKTELIDGVMTMATPATVIHESMQGFLYKVLGLYVEINDLGVVLGPNAPVFIIPENIFAPDIMFIAKARRAIITPKEVHGAPDLVIELLSASTAPYDRGRKRQIYEQAGVRELWLIDPYGPLGSRFYQLRDDRFVEIEPLGGEVKSSVVTGFALNLRWLWPESGQGPVTAMQALRESGALEGI